MSTLDNHLKALVVDLTAELPEVTERRMFGSDAFFANGNIFALIWDSRVLLKFPVAQQFEVARSLDGSGKFDPMGTGKTMSNWVAMPEAMHDDVDALRPWVEDAHRMAMSAPPKVARQLKPKAKKKAKKKGLPSPRPSPPRGRGRKKTKK